MRTCLGVIITLVFLVFSSISCTSGTTPLVSNPVLNTPVTAAPSPKTTTPIPTDIATIPTLAITPSRTVAPASTFTPIPSIAATLPDGPPVLLLYNGTDLARTDVDGSAVEPLIASLSGLSDNVWMYFWNNPPLVSPDGRWLITHSSVSDSRANWQLADLQTGAVSASGHGQSRLSPAWSPDSQRFAYLADGQICIYSLLDKTDTCTPIAADLTGASWSPDGEYIAISQANFEAECCTGNVWLFSVADGEAKNAAVFAASPQALTEEIFEWIPGDSPILLIKNDRWQHKLYTTCQRTVSEYSLQPA